MTGDELRTLRIRQGLSRPALAAMAGLHPDSVKYWERKPMVNLRGHAPDLILDALGSGELSQKNVFPADTSLSPWGNFHSIMRAGGGVLGGTGISSPPKSCGARTRKGTPCRAKALPGKRRCKFHGGMSTGPKTPEGRERIAEAQRRRWAKRAETFDLSLGQHPVQE